MTLLDQAVLDMIISLKEHCGSSQAVADLIARRMSPELGAGVLLMGIGSAEATADTAPQVIRLARFGAQDA